ncbi:MAG: hypothetical protein WBA07_34615 [Rivularia sp. (in: cyanobacteria)]
MSDKKNQTKAKICNHKPGDKWEDGCCGDEAARNNLQIKDRRSKIEGQSL